MPRRVRPRLPEEWHVPEDPKLWITWGYAQKKLRNEKVYWVSTSSLRGRPHAAPVWGIWRKDLFNFETDPESVKGRNLRENPLVVVHVQDGLDTVIVEGTAKILRDSKELGLLKGEYAIKYDYRPDWTADSSQVVFQVAPEKAHAWRAPQMHRSLVNFVF